MSTGGYLLVCPLCGEQGMRSVDGPCALCGADSEAISRMEPGPWNEVR